MRRLDARVERLGISMQNAALSGGSYLRGHATPCDATDRHLVCLQQQVG